MKVEFIEKSGANHAFGSTLIGFDNGWTLSIGAGNSRLGQSIKLFESIFDKNLDIKNIAFLNGQEIVAHSQQNSQFIGTSLSASLRGSSLLESDACDTCGKDLFDVGSGLQRNTQCQLCWESECADSFWQQQHDDNSWELEVYDTPLEEIKKSLIRSLEEAKIGQRIPMAEMWEGIDD